MIQARLVVFFLFVFFFSIQHSSADEQLNYRAPTMLANTRPEMHTPGFWIGRHPSVDTVIMDIENIQDFNEKIRGKVKVVKDMTKLPESFSGDQLSEQLRSDFEVLKGKGYFLADGQPASDLFFQDQLSNLNLTSVASVIEPQYGFVLRYTNQRFLPTDEGFYETEGDWDFDYLQNNALELATPVVMIHKSFDSEWFYVLGPVSDGWIKAKDMIVCDRKDIEDYYETEKWAVTIEAKTDIFLDPKMTQFDQFIQMGGRLAKEKKQDVKDAVAVKVPAVRDDGRFMFKTVYLDKAAVSDGYLPYTARTMYQQAFKLLNQPYGWGGMYGEQDCSRFLQEIFATIGVMLPRDSKDQAKVGLAVASFDQVLQTPEEKVGLFEKATAGVSVLTLKGHIMLYLGMVDHKPYAMHAVWAYREPVGDEDRVRVINRVAVSDLDLGEGSKKGSLLKRVTGIRVISK